MSDGVAEEIRAMMARRRMTGRRLAIRLHVSPSWVNYRLIGKQPIDVDDLAAIARVLEVSVVDLLPASASTVTHAYPPRRRPERRHPPIAPPRGPAGARRPAGHSTGHRTLGDSTRTHRLTPALDG